MSPGRRRLQTALRIARVLTGALLAGSLLEFLGVPAGMLLGGMIGAAVANHRWTPRTVPAVLPMSLRYAGLIGLGSVTGMMVTVESLRATAVIAGPVAGAYLVFIALNLLFVGFLVHKYDVDPVSAVLAVTPGGLSEVTVMAIEKDARIALVLSVHAVRVLVIVLVLLPIVVLVVS